LLVIDLGQNGSFLEGPVVWFDTIDMEDLHGIHVGVLACYVVFVLGEHDIWGCKLTRKEILVGTL
jgi:hypothetical protein